MDIKKAVWIVLIAVVVSFNIQSSPSFSETTSRHGEVYERIMKSGTIRCGYIPYPPAMIIDPNTGEKSGIFYDVMNEIGKRLSLKIEWVQESGWGTYINDLKSDRIDMLCSAVWTNSTRAREVNHTNPLYYSAITAWARGEDNRFNDGLESLNSNQYMIAAIDGESANVIAKDEFPKAKIFSLPELSSVSDMALSVSTGKADVAFIESYIAHGFLKNNPGSIKQVGEPLRSYGNAMYMKKGEHDLRLMINTSIEEILNSNFLPALYRKYDVPPNSYR